MGFIKDFCSSCAGNTKEYWENWANANGSCKDYITETVPNFSLVGTLLLGFSLSTCLGPPDISHISWFITIMNISTACSMALIFISIYLHSQFMCCVDIENDKGEKATENFCANYGGLLISALTLILMIDAVSLSSAILIFFYDMYNIYVFGINLGIILVTFVFIMVLCFRMQTWNIDKNYGEMIGHSRSKKPCCEICISCFK